MTSADFSCLQTPVNCRGRFGVAYKGAATDVTDALSRSPPRRSAASQRENQLATMPPLRARVSRIYFQLGLVNDRGIVQKRSHQLHQR